MLTLTLQDIFGRSAVDDGSQIIVSKADLSFFSVGLDTFFEEKECLLAGLIKNLSRTYQGYVLDSDLSRIVDGNGDALLYQYEQAYTDAFLSLHSRYFEGDRIYYYYQLHLYDLSGNYGQDDSEFVSSDSLNVYLDKSAINTPNPSIPSLVHSLIRKFNKFPLDNSAIDYLGIDQIYKINLDAVVDRIIYQVQFSLPDNLKFDIDNLI